MCANLYRILVLGLLVPLGCTGSTDTPVTDPVGSTPSKVESGSIASASQSGGAEQLDYILSKYVKDDFFDYSGMKDNQEDLNRFDAFMKWQAEADISDMSREDQIAFYINAYNSCCIKAILDHYPVDSPMEIEGFFDKLKFKVAGEDLKIGGEDGDSMEYDRLIANYKDMRAHFAVVCADRGCLPLKAGAYKGETLDEDLETAAKKFVSDERQFKVDHDTGKVYIAKIFDWYGKKFIDDPKRPVQGERQELYLLPWLDEKTKKLLTDGNYEREFIKWDWTLNEQGKKYEEPEKNEDK